MSTSIVLEPPAADPGITDEAGQVEPGDADGDREGGAA